INGEKVIVLSKEYSVSRTVIYKWIKAYKKYGTNGLREKKVGRKRKARNDKKQNGRNLTPHERLRMVEEVTKEGKSPMVISKMYGVSRVTLYKWVNRYQKNPQIRINAVQDKKREVKHYHNKTPQLYEKSVLNIVIQHPEYGIRRIVKNLPRIGNKPILGHHGVQNVLNRNNLSTYYLRRAYSQKKDTPPVRTIEGILTWVTRFFGKPAVERRRLIRASLAFSLSTFATLVVVGASHLVLYTFNSVQGTTTIGLVFAYIALIMGSFFFLYSLKYYLTLAIVLSYSQGEGVYKTVNGKKRKNLFSWILGLGNGNGNGKNGKTGPVGLEPDLRHIKLEKHPFISVHIPFYNERRVVERAMVAATSFDYEGDYEVILCDDSSDETTDIIREYQKKYLSKGEKLKIIVNKKEGWELASVEVKPGVVLKHLHRYKRSGFKGAALGVALTLINPKTEFISVFDADFVPYPDTFYLFLKYFKIQNNNSEDYEKTNVAAVTGYQWHVLNKSENWITRGVRTEYAGSYVIERSGREILGLLKQIHGSVYLIRRKPLEEVGWDTSITEDFELTLKLYNAGYKVVYTPYIQAPAECVSTLRRLIRQRMRWAEGHSYNVKKMWKKLVFNPNLTRMEKLEFAYITPYYLQAFFFLVGTISWLIAETIFPAHLPFWTTLWGWSLVLTNMISLPLMNSVGLFLEESDERDYFGIGSFLVLSYITVPFQAYASVKGFLEKEEGTWFRTPKTGVITDVFKRGSFYRFITGIIPGREKSVVTYQTTKSPYLAINTANSSFNKFDIKLKKDKQWTGRLLLSGLLIITISLFTLSRGVPEVFATDWTNLYLHPDSISGCSGGDALMDATQGTSVDTVNYDAVGQVNYWYSDILPAGSDDASTGSGTWNYYFEGAWTGGTKGDQLTFVAAVSIVDAGNCTSPTTEDVSSPISFNKNTSFPVTFPIILSNNTNQTITASTSKRLRLRLEVTGEGKTGGVRLDYDGGSGDDSRLSVVGITIPERVILAVGFVPLIPLMYRKHNKRRNPKG
ncbi:glycosyltransferase family 2 protein, partial [Patescibacteria group bacterium]